MELIFKISLGKIAQNKCYGSLFWAIFVISFQWDEHESYPHV
ncbi:hypothetical protein SERP2181 [Staphylococcus epidermidis RP62A]|uniref:Uncharacterized protein n=1 Tax=Staphylococcus epidermidis (strain ATCC 35984 / DSM 28319 / BCRC 17069 / CCUG 31568 / BM 3577 / RP62A) TaxID=176279 RepID=Q5HL06_STAEQ|nr:hypothetical protein SERP2181 [Staphylococcus epidermidis RP62A]